MEQHPTSYILTPSSPASANSSPPRAFVVAMARRRLSLLRHPSTAPQTPSIFRDSTFFSSLSDWSSEHLNFYRVHLLAFCLIPLVVSGIFYASNTKVGYVDSMFMCFSVRSDGFRVEQGSVCSSSRCGLLTEFVNKTGGDCHRSQHDAAGRSDHVATSDPLHLDVLWFDNLRVHHHHRDSIVRSPSPPLSFAPRGPLRRFCSNKFHTRRRRFFKRKFEYMVSHDCKKRQAACSDARRLTLTFAADARNRINAIGAEEVR